MARYIRIDATKQPIDVLAAHLARGPRSSSGRQRRGIGHRSRHSSERSDAPASSSRRVAYGRPSNASTWARPSLPRPRHRPVLRRTYRQLERRVRDSVSKRLTMICRMFSCSSASTSSCAVTIGSAPQGFSAIDRLLQDGCGPLAETPRVAQTNGVRAARRGSGRGCGTAARSSRRRRRRRCSHASWRRTAPGRPGPRGRAGRGRLVRHTAGSTAESNSNSCVASSTISIEVEIASLIAAACDSERSRSVAIPRPRSVTSRMREVSSTSMGTPAVDTHASRSAVRVSCRRRRSKSRPARSISSSRAVPSMGSSWPGLAAAKARRCARRRARAAHERSRAHAR